MVVWGDLRECGCILNLGFGTCPLVVFSVGFAGTAVLVVGFDVVLSCGVVYLWCLLFGFWLVAGGLVCLGSCCCLVCFLGGFVCYVCVY